MVAGPTGLITAVATEFVSGNISGLGSLGTQNQSTPAGTVYN
jgi:ABC-type nitrate/sulfonate/bicarbonate transport system permease component